MRFNNYLWNLYKQTDGYKEHVGHAKKVQTIHRLIETLEFKSDEDKKETTKLFKEIYKYFKNKNFTLDNVEDKFLECIKEGIDIKCNDDVYIKPNSPLDWCSNYIRGFTTDILYSVLPDFFFIYLFDYDSGIDFKTFTDICEYFEIPLPVMPSKKDKLERALYYVKICKMLYEFRKLNNITEEELYAFIYDYACNIVMADKKEENDVLPNPSKVWYIGNWDNEFANNAAKDTIDAWQSYENMKFGDIVIMYLTAPVSAIHSVWRACRQDVFIDPFHHFYNAGYIGKPIKVPLIPFKEIKENNILSKNSIVKMSFQGVRGSPVAYDEYMEMIRIWKEKGFDTSSLPQIEKIEGLDENISLTDEFDVEEYLVGPFLKLLGYEDCDYKRQMPLRMGRGIRYYPDYAFFPNAKRGEESALFVLETKFSIRSKKDFSEAFYQARSYACRLLCSRFVLAAKEGVWIFMREKESFYEDKYKNLSWNELKDRDNFHKTLTLIGKEYILKKGVKK